MFLRTDSTTAAVPPFHEGSANAGAVVVHCLGGV